MSDVVTNFHLLAGPSTGLVAKGQPICLHPVRVQDFDNPVTIVPNRSFSVIGQPGSGSVGEVGPRCCAGEYQIAVTLGLGSQSSITWVAYTTAS